MATGLLALLDDVAGITKIAAASIDDVTAQAARSGLKAAGVVIDDAAVAPAYVTGFTADRELPIVAKITKGSLKNKLLFLLPGALALDAFAPWAVTPLLMAGGVYLSYEGAEKVIHAFAPGGHGHAAHATAVVAPAVDAVTLENSKVDGAIRTDFILSAEIMAITLASIPTDKPFLEKAVVLGLVAVAITLVVYGAVAIIVKADDVGLAMARGRSAFGRSIGTGIVKAMPGFLKVLSVVGTAAMIWVGGGIVVHGLEAFGMSGPAHLVHDLSHAASEVTPVAHGLVEWAVGAFASGVVGLIVGAIAIPAVGLAKRIRNGFRPKPA